MLRNGPGMFKIGDTEYKHWFDGLAYIQRYHFADGKMYYSARFLESEQYKESMKAQRIIYTAFGTRSFPDPCKKLYGSLSTSFSLNESRDNCNVAFTTVGDGVYALTETKNLVRIDIDSLDYEEKVNICDLLKITLHTYTAHCHSDTDGNIWNIGSQFGPTSNYIFAKTVNPLHIKGSSNSHSMEGTELLGMIPATDPLSPSYYHSFAVTEDFFVLFETPERIDVCKLVGRDTSKMSLNECMFWDENAGVDVIIFDRITRKKVDRKVTSDAFFTFHHANAYQKDGYLIIDYCKIINPGNFDDLLLEHMRDGTFRTRNPNLAPYLHRMIVPMQINENSKPGDDLLTCCSFANGCKAILKEDGSIHCTDTRMCDISFEFPRYCYDLNMKDYRYVYGACILDSKLFKNGMARLQWTCNIPFTGFVLLPLS
ncbi:hypothetical protein RB195_011770 [Necator americanus]|uniref:Uncharacterized protein n=1 Tax=Necator americanus TaxID=51031 RepID=A0ABR1D3Y8_NECAM